jgi:hypothetical protein
MARISTPDNLAQVSGSTGNVIFDTTALTIELVTGQDPVNGVTLDTDGVTLQALYSFAKNEWRDDSLLIKFPFPFVAITGEQFELISGWDFLDATTKNLIRDAGWALRDSNGTTLEEYMNITSLGLFNDSGVDQAYYLQVDGGTPTDIVLAGEVNQAIQIFGSGSFDYRDFYRIYLREPGKIYGFYDLNAEQNIPQLTFRKYALPLVNSIDLKYPILDTAIDANTDGTADVAPYSGMSITYFGTNQSRTIGGIPYNFDIIINGNSGTAEQIYQFVQWSLRQSNDIDAGGGTVRGDTAEELLRFIGDTLRTATGVYIDNFQATDTNRLEFTTVTGLVVTFPFVASGFINFNDNLQNDVSASYFVFYLNDDAGDNTGRDYGTANAIIVNNNSGNPLTGSVSGSSQISFDYDYDGNIQRGNASSGSAAPIVGVSLGLTAAQYVSTVSTINRSNANSINFVAALERNYVG